MRASVGGNVRLTTVITLLMFLLIVFGALFARNPSPSLSLSRSLVLSISVTFITFLPMLPASLSVFPPSLSLLYRSSLILSLYISLILIFLLAPNFLFPSFYRRFSFSSIFSLSLFLVYSLKLISAFLFLRSKPRLIPSLFLNQPLPQSRKSHRLTLNSPLPVS